MWYRSEGRYLARSISTTAKAETRRTAAYEKACENLELAPRKDAKALTVARCGEGIHLTGREAEDVSQG